MGLEFLSLLLLIRHGFAIIIPDTRLSVLFKNHQLKVNVKTVEAYTNRHLYKLGRTVDGNTIIPFMGCADNDEESPSPTEKGLYVSPSIRGHLIYNLMTMNFTIVWDSMFNYTSHLNYGGRGLVYSDGLKSHITCLGVV
jgi:hypothetical protein